MKLDLPAGPFAGYIFDLDGTLIDTMPLHFRAWDAALRELGSANGLSEELFYSLGGVPTKRVAELLVEAHKLEPEPLELFQLKEKKFLSTLDQVRLIEPVIEIARAVAKHRPVSIASGGPREVVLRSLRLAGLEGLFPVVISADDVVHGKPAPEMFLLAAKRMGVKPEECLVFEDAEPGVQAAIAAGMRFVRVDSRKIG